MASVDDLSGRLPVSQCMELLASVPVGRIAYTRQALPAVDLVGYTLSDGIIVIKTSRRGTLAAAIGGSQIVAFEADQVDYQSRSGWSVTVVGHAQLVTGADEPVRRHPIGRQVCTGDDDPVLIGLTPGPVKGRRLNRIY